MKTRNATTTTRRNFLRASAAIGLFTIVPRKALGGPGVTAPSEELTKAVIGVGGMGKGHLSMPGSRLLAVCDVDRNHLAKAMEIGKQVTGDDVAGYGDFREVLERSDIDIVHIPTPPHWHALISVAAARAGKDIWCEKPMARTIYESQQVVKAVQEHGRIFRLNTWFRFQGTFYGMDCEVKQIKKVVENRLLGWPLKVTVGATTGFNWKVDQWSGRTDLKPEPVPEVLDYDLWLGPAPWKPYSAHRTHATFRGYWDYDGGGLGDMGQHYLDPVQYLLEKDDTGPVEVEVDAPQQHDDAVGSWRRITYRYADGCEIILDGVGADQGAAYIEGPEGKLFPKLESTVTGLKEKLATLPDPAPQIGDFSEAVRTRQKFALNESNGHRSCSLVNLGVIAVRLGRNLKYDPVAERFIDDEGANRLLKQPMRGPWQI